MLKNATGYNLTQLIVGSEGTLGIVTKIVLRLIPHPTNDVLMLAPFSSAEKACEAVNAIFRAGVTPSGLEFMERDAIEWAAKHVGETSLPMHENIKAHLLIEVDGNDADALYRDAEKITEVLQQFDCGEILFADSAQQKADLWKLRRSVAEAVKMNSVYKEEDTVVPRARLPQLLKGVKRISSAFGFQSVCYGHAGDGGICAAVLQSLSECKAKMEAVGRLHRRQRLVASHPRQFFVRETIGLEIRKTPVSLAKSRADVDRLLVRSNRLGLTAHRLQRMSQRLHQFRVSG